MEQCLQRFDMLQVHINAKPPYSFSCLIFMAIEDSSNKALPVKDIYAWILDHFPYFRNAPTGWKNSVRHNLSLNKCFRKVEKAPVSFRISLILKASVLFFIYVHGIDVRTNWWTYFLLYEVVITLENLLNDGTVVYY